MLTLVLIFFTQKKLDLIQSSLSQPERLGQKVTDGRAVEVIFLCLGKALLAPRIQPVDRSVTINLEKRQQFCNCSEANLMLLPRALNRPFKAAFQFVFHHLECQMLSLTASVLFFAFLLLPTDCLRR